jgi:hypothetical protein
MRRPRSARQYKCISLRRGKRPTSSGSRACGRGAEGRIVVLPRRRDRAEGHGDQVEARPSALSGMRDDVAGWRSPPPKGHRQAPRTPTTAASSRRRCGGPERPGQGKFQLSVATYTKSPAAPPPTSRLSAVAAACGLSCRTRRTRRCPRQPGDRDGTPESLIAAPRSAHPGVASCRLVSGGRVGEVVEIAAAFAGRVAPAEGRISGAVTAVPFNDDLRQAIVRFKPTPAAS